MKGFSFIKKLLFLFIMGVGIVSLSSYSTYMDYSIDDSISSTDSPQQAPPTTLSSGTAAGYDLGSVKPFSLDGTNNGVAAGYIGSDGYLYTGGYQWGGVNTYYKQTNAGTNIVDYSVGSYYYGIMVNSSGTVKTAVKNSNTSATWSTVSVGGSTTNGKAVEMGESYQMVLNTSDVLYTSAYGATTMTSIVSSAATSSSRDGIVDFAVEQAYQFVLYGNGDLYRGFDGAVESGMTKVASNVEMFDYDGDSSYVYIYNSSNQIQYAAETSSTFYTLATVADVVQIRGGYESSTAYAGWGYLTSNGTLKTYESNSTPASTNTLTRTLTGVDYFDLNHSGTWGYLKDGKMYFWCTNSNHQYITTATSPTVVSGTYATNNDFSIEDLAGTDRDLQNTPPAWDEFK